jgi:hypothetical protein
VGELRMAALRVLLIPPYEPEHGMPCRFGGKAVEARFSGDIEEWPCDRHLSHVALQDRCCLGWLDVEENETLPPPSATQGYLPGDRPCWMPSVASAARAVATGCPGIADPGNLPVRGHQPASLAFLYQRHGGRVYSAGPAAF